MGKRIGAIATLRHLVTLVALSCCAAPGLAVYINVWEPVPLERLVRNLEAKVRAKPKDAEALYTLGRIHSLGFLRGGVPIRFYRGGELRPFPPDDYIREPRAQGKPDASSLLHLQKSIRYYSKAIGLKPQEPIYHLGRGWMLLQGSDYAKVVDWPLGKPGEKRTREQWVREAANSFRWAFDLAEQKDLREEYGGGSDWSISLEAGESLLKLYEKELAGDRDAPAQRKRIAKTVKALKSKPAVVSPVIFPLDRTSPLASLVDASHRVRFDLAGDGESERWPWLTNNAALLVWDPRHTGRITSGRQLFGSRTWQMFWRHGYQPLAALDDDRSGELTGKELAGISAWVDRNGNGVSEPGEVVPVSKLGITGIIVRPARREGGIWMHPAGLRYSDGGRGPTYDWTPTSVGR